MLNVIPMTDAAIVAHLPVLRTPWRGIEGWVSTDYQVISSRNPLTVLARLRILKVEGGCSPSISAALPLR